MHMACSMFARSVRRWFWVPFMLALSFPLAGTETALASPTVTDHSPAAGATDIPINGTVTATFSEPLNRATVTPGSFVLTQPVRIRSVAAGENYTLIIKENGTAAGWGYNGNGQTAVPNGLDGIAAIAAGGNHAVALKTDGTVTAWGDNTYGQTAIPAGIGGVTAVAAGGSFTLALKDDSTVLAWGDNSRGQRTVPGGLAGVSRIAAGSAHALALKTDGTVTAWGDNTYGQATVPAGLAGVIAVTAGYNHSLALKADGSIVAWGANNKGQVTVPAGLSGVIAIAAGLDYSMALKNDGSVVAWGDNGFGQRNLPAGLSGITTIAGGYYHAVALKSDGSVISWGDNSCSQTTLPAGLAGVVAAAAGDSHTVALKSDGTLFAWGYNSSGQAAIPAGLSGITAHAAGFAHTLAVNAAGSVSAWGKNDYGQTSVPAGLTGVTAVAAGDNHSVALKNDGTVVAWGLDSAGQATVPAGLPVVTKIAAGSAHTLALKQDGTVAAWGSTAYNETTPPLGLSAVTAIAAAGYHSVALKSDGRVVAWGDNTRGQSTVPEGLSGVIAIAAGTFHTVALKDDGTVVAWGANTLGQCNVPVGLDRVVAIAAGNAHTLAVKDDGTLVGWGDNKIGQATVPHDPYGEELASAVSYSTADNSATITPAAPLPLATTLTATLNRGVRSLDGTHAAADYSWSFTTVTSPVTTTASPAGGTYSSPQSVTLTANEPATIYYTTNGATPTTTSNVYSGAIPIPATTTLKFFARDTSGNSEAVKTAVYVLNLDTTPPVTTPSPAGGTYSSPQSVTLTANEPATIYYTTNGATPTTASNVYSGAIPIPATTTLKFFARDTAGNSEAVRTALYTILQNQTISFAPLPTRTYGDPSFTLTATASSGLTVSYTSSNPAVATVSGATVTIVGAGTAVITASQGGDGSYNPATAVARTLTVGKASLTVRAADATRAYGTGNPVFGAVYSGFVNADTPAALSGSPALSTTAIATSPVGAYPITAAAGTLGSPNYGFTFAGGTLTVTKATANVTLGGLGTVYDGTPKTATATTVPAGLAVTLTYDGGAGAPVAAGNYSVVATVSDPNYAGSASGTMNIARASQTITFTQLPAKTFGDSAFTLTATASSGLPTSYSSSNPAVAMVSGSTVTIVSAGSTTITASQSGDGNYNPAPEAVQTLTVNKATATVTLGSLAATYTGSPKPATATTVPAGLVVTLIYDGVATAPTAAGSYSVIATVSDPNYQGSANGTLTIVRGDQLITFAPLAAKTYGDPDFALGATSGSGLPVSYTSSNPAVATVSGQTVTIVGAGSAVITASQGGDGNYNPAPNVSRNLTINKAPATVTIGSLGTVYDGNPKTATATTVPAGLAVSFTYNGAASAPTAAGSYAVVGTVNDTNYEGSASGTLTIAKADQTITFGLLAVKTYGDAAFPLAATAGSGLAVTYGSSNTSVATVSGSTVTIVGAGTATITATQAGNANYNAAPAVTQTLTVNKAVATITFGQLTFTYDGNPKPVTVTTLPAGLAVTITYDGSATPPVEVGKYAVVATVNDPNYQGTATATEEIAKRSQTITFGPLPVKTYGDAPFTFTANSSSNLNVVFEYDPAIVAITKQGQKYLATIVGAGTTVITATQPGNRNYSEAPPVSQTLTVNKAAATVTLSGLSATYDGNAKAATATTTPVGLAVSFTYNGSATPPTAAGGYSVVGTITNANYQGSASGNLVIAKAGQSITFAPLTARTYGSAPFTPGATASSGLSVSYTSSNPAVATVSGTTVTIVGIGTATITASQTGDGNYTSAVAVPQTLTVTKGTATVTLGSLTTTYSGTPRPVTATTAPVGLTVTLTYNGLATAPTAVGSYTVVATVSDANFEGGTTGTLTIDKSAQTVTFAPISGTSYGEPAFSLAATASSGLPVTYASSNPAVATVSGTTVTITGAGTTTITASQGGNGNYSPATAVVQTLTVGKGAATVTLGDLTTVYNGTPRAATATTVPGGLPVTLTYNGLATAPTAAGSYPVTATVNSPNYQGSASGTLTIAKGTQTITFGALPAKTVGNAPFTLSATASSGLAVSYTSSNPSVATVSGATVTIVGAGTTTITASQTGDGNYSAAGTVPQTLTVTAAPVTGGRTAVTIGTTTSYYDTVTAACAAVTPGSTATIKLQGIVFAEALTINSSNAMISISGGYDSGFTSATGMTTIQGSLVIRSGTLVANRLVIM